MSIEKIDVAATPYSLAIGNAISGGTSGKILNITGGLLGEQDMYSLATGNSITGATAGSILFAGVAGVLAQDNANLFYDNTNDRLGLGINSSILARLHSKGSGATVATSAFIATNGSGERIIEARDDKSLLIGTYTKLSDDGTKLVIKDRYDQPILNLGTNNQRCFSMIDNGLGGAGSFAGGGRYSYSVASGQDSLSFGEYVQAKGRQSTAFGIFGIAEFENEHTIGAGINTVAGDHKLVFGFVQPNATTTPQNTLIPIKSYDFTPYFSTYTSMLCKVRTVISDSMECQTIEQTFTCKIATGVMSILGAVITDYNGGDAAMSTGAMTYSFAGKVMSIGYTTPTVRANGAYNISTIFEFNIIGY
jgi:hypothetical protein